MNGFVAHGLDEAAFGEKRSSFRENVRTFDAFPKTKPSYTRRTSVGGYTTLVLLAFSAFLSLSELLRWYHGHETHLFSVEKGISHQLQINLDIVVPMLCNDLHVNVQDASGDRILAGDMLSKDPTAWRQWSHISGTHRLADQQWVIEEERDTHAGHVLGEVGGLRQRKWKKTPKRARGEKMESCRIYGSLDVNKVQADFHITARGHGYIELGEHLDHNTFNFSHIVNELSFGPHYPSLLNPLDRTSATTNEHFFKYQYYLSVVPTIYTRSPPPPPSSSLLTPSSNFDYQLQREYVDPRTTILTNQYAATSQSHPVSERMVPGIFFKFDIEPIL
ncbi:MAG: hypothetical protein Q9190_002144, partial [Brigantiaea leucoxantha]